jgi:hypothetical protein
MQKIVNPRLFDEIRKFPELIESQNFLDKWVDALNSLGTNINFITGIIYSLSNFEYQKVIYPCVYVYSPGYSKRKELMKKQILYKPKESSYQTYNFDQSCLLCLTLIQGLDAISFHNDKQCIIDSTNDAVLVPNKYPGRLGHSLILPRNHDNLSQRINLVSGQNIGFSRRIQGKTRGNIPSVDFLLSVIKISQKYDLISDRNHCLDGMSLSNHDHFHAEPIGLPWNSFLKKMIREKENLGNKYYRLGCTPLDSLVITGENIEEIARKAYNIIERMETDNQVFTLTYYDYNFIISPRYETDKYLDLGFGTSRHFFKDEENYHELVLDKTPKKGEYPWKKYCTKLSI